MSFYKFKPNHRKCFQYQTRKHQITASHANQRDQFNVLYPKLLSKHHRMKAIAICVLDTKRIYSSKH